MLKPSYAPKFEKDYKRIRNSGKNINSLDRVLQMIIHEEKLPPKFNDHKLHGRLKEYRECHIQHDLLLMYKIDGNRVFFTRAGSHSEIFD